MLVAQRHKVTDFHGIIMYRKDYQERDLLVKMLTLEHGKKMFFVRGAKKRGFKLTGDILPFTYGHYVGDIREEACHTSMPAKRLNTSATFLRIFSKMLTRPTS